ncbi:MAG: RNA polymerase sigma factor [Acidimicrobiales bacterium]
MGASLVSDSSVRITSGAGGGIGPAVVPVRRRRFIDVAPPDAEPPDAEPPDAELLAGLACGHPVLAAAFVRRFQRRVFGLAASIVGDHGVAEEVAQEAFVRAWRGSGGFDPRRGEVAAWLLAITRNLAIDAVRADRRRPRCHQVVAEPDLEAPGATPEDAAATAEDVARLRVALARLPEEQRRAIVLARLLGHTAAEVGRLEGVPLGTAKTRIRAALCALRRMLAAEDRR